MSKNIKSKIFYDTKLPIKIFFLFNIFGCHYNSIKKYLSLKYNQSIFFSILLIYILRTMQHTLDYILFYIYFSIKKLFTIYFHIIKRFIFTSFFQYYMLFLFKFYFHRYFKHFH
ncbi:hypothetical protein EDEG_04100 [Edhazardia aedis USNM 41457]|uniref:Uncharacterized protein n=1 Tax=Edhazardia aedis (strain USNM 41457) TaxID=1003232 RepID=J9DBZ3_EDHAE|nr:hypothetical protein EDEG_04100 [Edhazardia aedis USNM 41457]|eukprot:EJW05251.1 hypothetical protein EDEG_04100 [Edhazardia aedis USNM 41457]